MAKLSLTNASVDGWTGFISEPGLHFCWRKPETCIEIWRCYLSLQGDIVSCAGTYIHVWSINGSPTASVNTFTGRSQQIMCCFVSEMNEWDTQNVIVTGHSDGVVRVSTRNYSLENWVYTLVVAVVREMMSMQHSVLTGAKSSPAILKSSTWTISPAGRRESRLGRWYRLLLVLEPAVPFLHKVVHCVLSTS